MNPSELSDLLNRIASEKIKPGESLVANVEYSSARAFFSVPGEKLASSGVLLISTDIVRALVPDSFDVLSSPHPQTGNVGDMGYNLRIFVPLNSSSERPVHEGYRLMVSPAYKGVSLQYTASSTGQMLAFFGRLLSAPEGVRNFLSANYHVLPSLRSSDLVRASRHFDSFPPDIRRVPVSAELIEAFRGSGWLLYRLFDGPNGQRIAAKEGPAKTLLIGDAYSVVPVVDDPTSVQQIIDARTHAKVTNQGFHPVGLPFIITSITFGRDTISCESASGHMPGVGVYLNPYSPLGTNVLKNCFSRYDPSRAPETTGPSN